jgi:hypothetical protein
MCLAAAGSASILISAFFPQSQADGPNGNSVLYVDNLSFDRLIAAVPDAPAPAIGRAVFRSNPVGDKLRFAAPDAQARQSGTIALYTTGGKIVLSRTIAGAENSVNISRIPPGVYLLVLDMNGGKTTRRIIKTE